MARNAKLRRRESNPSAAMVTEKIPLVSVIIPMYNSAKFIPQTLESLLYQTMKDFEVIVADDCSTDNSVEVVESFKEKFANGRVKLSVIKLPKNTGTPGLPRNIGIQFACGKYIAFLDSDDLFTKTALEELSTLAEEYQADVVHLRNNFILWGGKPLKIDDPAFTNMNELTNPKNFSLQEHKRDSITSPTLDSDLAPNVVYIARPRLGSASRYKASAEKSFLKEWITLKNGFVEFVRIMNKLDFFNNHRDYHYAVLDWFVNVRFMHIAQYYLNNRPFKLNDIINEDFHSDDAALSSYLFNTVNIQRLQIMHLQQELAKFQKQ